jgi:dCMP deaminase
MRWDEYFIKMAFLVAEKSKDPSTKVGCVIVGPDNEIRSTGFNGFPRGVAETVTVTPQAHFVQEQEYDIRDRDIKLLCTCGHVDKYTQGDSLNGNLPAHFTGAPRPEDWIEELNERWERPIKYEFVEHAERNAVYNAARVGIPLEGCRAYLNWEPYPCVNCAKAFVQAGITTVIGPDIEFPNHKKVEAPDEDQWASGDQWKFGISQKIMDEAGVEYVRVPWDAQKDTA